VLGVAILVVPIVILVLGAWTYRWMSDDGFINLRVISEIKAGHGPVFNAGERVEATTSPLWLYTLLLADLIAPLRSEWVAVLGGLALTLGGVALALAGSVRLQRDLFVRPLWLPLGALVFVAYAPVWRFATGGLENGLTFAWLGACLWLLAGWTSDDRMLSRWHALVLGLGPLIRPELMLFSLAFVTVVGGVQWRRQRWRDRFALVASAFALPVLYEVFRMGYYGSLVPNTAFAKEASRSYWEFGWYYLRQTVVHSYALWIPLVILVVAGYGPLVWLFRRRRHTRAMFVVGAFVVAALVSTFYIVRVGGDYMEARLLLPSLFGLLVPIAVLPATRQFVGALLVVPWVVVAIVALRSDVDNPRFGIPRNAVTAEQVLPPDFDEQFEKPGVYVDYRRLPGQTRSGDLLPAFYGVGATSYRLGPDVYVLDLLGLGDAFTSHLELARRGIIAHEKPLPPPWIAVRLVAPGTPLQASDFPKPFPTIFPIEHPAGEPFDRRVAEARRALQCSQLRDFIDSYRAPMTVGRFIDNLGAAFSNYSLRIPPEPRDAVEKFCAKA
jgi:arabinofuranosyltransferase